MALLMIKWEKKKQVRMKKNIFIEIFWSASKSTSVSPCWGALLRPNRTTTARNQSLQTLLTLQQSWLAWQQLEPVLWDATAPQFPCHRVSSRAHFVPSTPPGRPKQARPLSLSLGRAHFRLQDCCSCPSKHCLLEKTHNNSPSGLLGIFFKTKKNKISRYNREWSCKNEKSYRW